MDTTLRRPIPFNSTQHDFLCFESDSFVQHFMSLIQPVNSACCFSAARMGLFESPPSAQRDQILSVGVVPMKSKFVRLLVIGFVSLMPTLFAQDVGQATKDAAKATDNAAKKAGDATVDAAQKTGDATKDAAKATDDAAKKTGKKMKKGSKDAAKAADNGAKKAEDTAK
jgi:type IV secretory pathway VirB6-like protein